MIKVQRRILQNHSHRMLSNENETQSLILIYDIWATDLLLNTAEELEHGDAGWRLRHAQHQADSLQLLEHRGAGLLCFLLRFIQRDHPRCFQLWHQKRWNKNNVGTNITQVCRRWIYDIKLKYETHGHGKTWLYWINFQLFDRSKKKYPK